MQDEEWQFDEEPWVDEPGGEALVLEPAPRMTAGRTAGDADPGTPGAMSSTDQFFPLSQVETPPRKKAWDFGAWVGALPTRDMQTTEDKRDKAQQWPHGGSPRIVAPVPWRRAPPLPVATAMGHPPGSTL
jgi:hypothetical protein